MPTTQTTPTCCKAPGIFECDDHVVISSPYLYPLGVGAYDNTIMLYNTKYEIGTLLTQTC